MSIRITDVDDGLGNLIVMSGVITEAEFFEVMQRHFTQDPEKFKRYRYSLNDVSKVTEVEPATYAWR